MTMKNIREMARSMGIKNINRYRKDTLIRVIQETEGNRPCFKGPDHCGEAECLWRNECRS